MFKVIDFFEASTRKVVRDASIAFDTVKKQILNEGPLPKQKIESTIPQKKQTVDNNFNEFSERPLEDLELQQSKVISTFAESRKKKLSKNQNKSFKNQSVKASRVKQIEAEKRKIMEDLRKLDVEILHIKQESEEHKMEQSQFHRQAKIADDIEAKRQAQELVRQLHLQRKKLEDKKRKNQQKELQAHQRQEEMRRQERRVIQDRLKEEKRNQIARRMSQERKKRIEREIIEKQSNQLLVKLKKEEEQEKEKQQLPSQLVTFEHKKKVLEKKNNFHLNDIEEHQKKYRQIKQRQEQLRKERSQSIKVRKAPNYGKNVWIERIEEEEAKRKEEEKIKELARREQLQKRMKYGNVVKEIWRQKHKKRGESISSPHEQKSDHVEGHQGADEESVKPLTPDVNSHLPKIPRSNTTKANQTEKKFKEKPNSTLYRKPYPKASSALEQPSHKQSTYKSPSKDKALNKQRDPEQEQRFQKQKQRELQLRKQTKERLKKLETKSIDKPKSEKIKYENYMPKIKIKKKDQRDEWRRIMSNDNMSKEQKYNEMLSRANVMENQAKLKEEHTKVGDEDAVNLYIGSIQAKLALLEKF